MIKIQIATNGKEVFDSFDEDNMTLNECALTIYKLEQMKLELLSREFESKEEVRTGDLADEEGD